jgi:membrane protein involved in colicin uptake
MWDKIISFIEALLIHVFLLAILLFSLYFPQFNLPTSTTPENRVVDDSAVLAELERLRREDDSNKIAQRTQQYASEPKESEQLVIQEQAHLELLRQQQEERQQLEVLKQNRLAEEEVLENILREKAEMLEKR